MNIPRLPRGKDSVKHQKINNLYSYWQAFVMSFYSMDIYVDVRHRWRGFGAIYVLLVMAIISLPLSIKIIYEKHNYYYQVMLPIIKKLPDLKLVEGELVFNKSQPYFMNSPVSHQPVVIIDTTGKVTDLPNSNYPEAALLFTKHAMISRFGQMPPSIEKYQKDMSVNIEPTMLIPLFDRLKTIFVYAFYPSMMMFWYGVFYSFLCIIAFLFKMFSVILLKYEINYKNALRLASVSSTPMLVLSVIFAFLGIQSKSAGWTIVGCWLAYFIFAIRANKLAAKHPVLV